MSGASRVPTLGPGGIGWVALQGVCFALIAAAIAAAPSDTADDPTATGTRHLIGYVLCLLGAVLIGSGIAELRAAHALSVLPEPRPDGDLAQRGAYRLVRHPIYGGLVLGSVGLGVITPWIGTLVSVALLAVVLDLKRRREEAWLAERFFPKLSDAF